jgi:predicted TIM-barrel fold metal-dependent hydrolase
VTTGEWRDRIRKIAALPNTYVKLGGLGMKMIGFTFYANPDPPSSPDLEKVWRPYIETCIEAFGPQRSMFESNFPGRQGTCSYQSCGTPSNASPPAIPPTKRPLYSVAMRRKLTV